MYDEAIANDNYVNFVNLNSGAVYTYQEMMRRFYEENESNDTNMNMDSIFDGFIAVPSVA